MTIRRANRENRYSLSTKRGWRAYVKSTARKQPERLSRAELAALPEPARAEYDEDRAVWHANLGPIKTPQLLAVHDDLWNIIGANRQDGDKVRPAAVIDAFPGLGKSTIANSFGRDFHQRRVTLRGETTEGGHERIPVVRIQLTDTTNRRDLNSMLCRFFNLPSYDKGNANQLGNKAVDAALACEVELIIFDDVHFLDMNRRDGRAVANHFKSLSNSFPATFLHVGVGLAERGLLDEGLRPGERELAQNSRRMTPLTVDPFEIETENGRRTWRSLLLAIEQGVVLAETRPGMIADELSDELFARSTGHFASLMALITRGCERCIRSGDEQLTRDVLAQVKNDAAAERGRLELVAALEQGLMTSRPRPPRRATTSPRVMVQPATA